MLRPALAVVLAIAGACDREPSDSPARSPGAARPAAAERARARFDARPARVGPTIAIELSHAPKINNYLQSEITVVDSPAGRRRERTLYARPIERRWIPFRVLAPNAIVDVDGAENTGAGEFRVDLYEPLLNAPPEVISVASRPRDVADLTVRVIVSARDAAGADSEAVLDMVVPVEPEVDLRRRLHRVTSEPIEWSAELAPEGEFRPLIWVLASEGWGGVRPGESEPGKPLRGPSLSVDGRRLRDFGRIRDVQLVAVSKATEKVVGRCKNCSDIGNPWHDEEPGCDRTQYFDDVSVYVARTGKRIARKRFAGKPPPDCAPRGEVTDLFATIGEMPLGDVAAWLRGVSNAD